MEPRKPNRNFHSRNNQSNRHRNQGGNNRPRHPDAEVDQRIRELDAERDPLSLPEEIVVEATRSGGSVGVPDKLTDDSPLNLASLQKLPMDALVALAEQEGVPDIAAYGRVDLSFCVLKRRMANNGLMYGEGTLEILPDGFGFLRSPDAHYISCPDDIYVSPSQIRRFGLQTGCSVAGQIRPPKENERYFALLRVEAINRRDPADGTRRTAFEDLTPLHPDTRIIMETKAHDISSRVIDLLAPIGFGQRGLIVSPPRAGKTVLMQKMAQSVLDNYPDAYVIILLVDERPEEVTDMERVVKGTHCEVISSTFDETPARHIQVSQMVIEKAKRMVEYGIDVVIFLDSITRLGRAYNADGSGTGKLLSGGLDAGALQKPKAFFGSARKVEEGGSLTIIATALIDTGSRLDDVIFEEFKGTGNMEIVLDRTLVERRIWPAIDPGLSGTRREEMLMDEQEYHHISMLRRVMAEMSPADSMDKLIKQLQTTQSNAEFLLSLKEA